MIELLKGDCRDRTKAMSDCSIDLIVTDCPYRLISGGCTNKGKGNGIFQREFASSGKLFAHNDITFAEWLPDAYRVLKPGTHCYIFCNGRNLKQLQAEAEKAGFLYQNTLVWDKRNVTQSRYYMNACEFILMLRKGKARTINNRGTHNILRIKNIIGIKKHPTEKPVELMQILIENSSNPGDTVFDPFTGSGSTAIACINTGRKFIGIEIDEYFFNIAKNRIDEAKGGVCV